MFQLVLVTTNHGTKYNRIAAFVKPQSKIYINSTIDKYEQTHRYIQLCTNNGFTMNFIPF